MPGRGKNRVEHTDFLGERPVGRHVRGQPMLEINAVERRFAGSSGVQGVSLTVWPGEVTCLLGPSGCGKSTTLRMIAGIERVDAGQISIAGQVVADARTDVPPEKRPVGMVFQDLALFPHMTIAQNVGFGLPRSGRGAAQIGHLLERVGLPGHADKYPHQLSGGEQQRIALIRALATQPRVMLLDEPFSSLDQRLRVEMRELALDLLREAGAAVVLVTHDPDEAMMMADRIAIMREGRILQEGAPLDLYHRPVDLAVAGFLSELNVFSGRVLQGHVGTPIGDLPVPGVVEGTRVHAAFRPEHLAARRGTRSSGQAHVLRVLNLGRENVIELKLPGHASYLRCSAPGHSDLMPGEHVEIGFDPDKALIFPH
ncbi:ATP-binding cassette domain-containing protein [Paracoccus litorisediminis]|uniref:ATP-binding cassette domain-containing protein n=1 Tax=Paracoccus litorisediminis TaxID=2006130 RepID=A0A844HP49_9RHOB|nr:ATP-binding cassette domain-containing protein [Paracoccus litorisediminis]